MIFLYYFNSTFNAAILYYFKCHFTLIYINTVIIVL